MTIHSSEPRIRPPAVADRFYPGNPGILRRQVLEHVDRGIPGVPVFPKAIIAPHAGYPYSGPIAGSAFLPWRGGGGRIRRVVLVGPSHYAGFRGLVSSSATAFATPLGEVPIDRDAVDELVRARLARVEDGPHQPEHSLEVELPFLQLVLGDFTIVPLLAGTTDGDEVAAVIESLWGGSETGIVISSDLSHYLDYATARSVDAQTAGAIETFETASVDSNHACGWLAIQGLLRVAKTRGTRPTTIDLRNSGDTAGSRDRVVGYGAWSFGN